MASIENTAKDIKSTYERTGEGTWVKMTVIAENMLTDVSVDQFAQAVRFLLVTDPDCNVMPEANQKTLTRMDRLYRVTWAGDENDYIAWI